MDERKESSKPTSAGMVEHLTRAGGLMAGTRPEEGRRPGGAQMALEAAEGL